MGKIENSSLTDRFKELIGTEPAVIASAPGRLEVLGNHTDYNGGLTLSCAVGLRCYAALAPLNKPVVRLATTMHDEAPSDFALDHPRAPHGRWENFVLGLLDALRRRGYDVPGFAMLIDSRVPRSAGVSSSAAMEMSALIALAQWMGLGLPPLELARIGQEAESNAVGARTGLLDQLSSLLGRRDHLLQIHFKTFQTRAVPLPEGWSFVAIDSGVKHDLTAEYNERRKACEAAAKAMGVGVLCETGLPDLHAARDGMMEEAFRCAFHVLSENQRVTEAADALASGDIDRLGQLMFASHESSRTQFRNSCPELDQLIDLARQDERCIGARLSGGGFGGISIHLVRQAHAQDFLQDMLPRLDPSEAGTRWSAVCAIDQGAGVDWTVQGSAG